MIKLKQKLIMYASGLLFLLTGCIQDGFFGNTPGEDDPLTFTFTVDGITTNSATRAAVPLLNDETTVETLHLLFFEESEDMSGALAGIVSLPGTSVGTAGKLTMETSYILPSTGALNASGNYNIIGIGNLNGYIPEDGDNETDKDKEVEVWLSQWTGVTEAFFRDNAAIIVSGTDSESDYSKHRPIKFNQLLMNGFVSKTTNTKNIQMVLSRNVARFDLENKSTTTPLQTVSIWNAFTKSSITGDAIFNYASEPLHTKRFYGIETDKNPDRNTVTGGLYAFANFSETPIINDKLTTCLIVGLEKSGSTRYYRINVNSSGASQLLKNNYAYKININSVIGDGYPSEEEAWEGTTNQLVYDVNFWGIDDNGLIVSDEFSLLAVPVKTAKFDKEGGENSYTITTFSTLENPEPLRIKSQFYEPSDYISAKISNGSLVITALPMITGETKRSGIITISYAGLETSVNVLQSADAGTYLEVTLDEGWKEFLPPTANVMTEFINVKASGSWTARLYGSENFALKNFMGDYVRQVSSNDFSKSRFHVYTQAANNDNVKIEKAFVLISLDSDPENYIAVVPVSQSSKGNLGTFPAGLDAIWFHGNKKLQTTAGNQMLSETHFKFKVSSSGSIAANNVRLTGANYDKFSFEYDAASGYITVWVNEINSLTTPYTAVLSVSDNRNATLLVSLVQATQELTIIPPAPTKKVPAKGDFSDPIVITIEGSAQWTATITTVTNGSRPIFNHVAELYTVDGVKYVEGTPTNKNLKVKFPKVYFPNRETEIKAIVEISIGGSTKKCEVYQEALTAKTVKIWNLRNGYYGSLGNSYIENYTTAIHNILPGSGGVGTKWTSVINPGTTYPSNTNYIHVGNYFDSSIDWSAVNSFRTNEDGIIVFTNDEYSGWSRNRAAVFLNPLGFSGFDHHVTDNCRLPSNITSTRVGEFLTTYGKYEILNPSSTTSAFQGNGVHSYITNYPTATAVPVVIHGTTANEIYMAIDPAQRVVYIGECEIFDQTGGSNDNRYKFMMNFVQYVINSAKYGSHFTDMLRKDGDFPTKISPMWDEDTWGDNRWPYYSN